MHALMLRMGNLEREIGVVMADNMIDPINLARIDS